MKKFEVKAEITAKLTQEDIDDIMVGALEGGINYWCWKAEVVGDYLGEFASDQISRGGTLKLYDMEQDSVYDFDLALFLRGFKLWLENGGDWYGAVTCDGKVDTGNIDAERCDAIVQYALFGDVIYG